MVGIGFRLHLIVPTHTFAPQRAPFHWPQPKVKDDAKLLRLRAAPGQGAARFVPEASEGWSAGFPIDTPGRFVVHCEQGVRPDEPGW